MAPKQTPGMTGSKPTKDERREAAREKARLLREQEAKRAKRNRMLIIAAVVLVLALVVFAIVQITRQNNVAAASTANVGEDYGISISTDGAATTAAEGGASEVAFYVDSTCPHCVELDNAALDPVKAHIAAGDVQFKYYPVAIDPIGPQYHDQSQWGTTSEFYIASQAPEYFHAYHEALMNDQTGWFAQISKSAQAGIAAPGTDVLGEIARSAGVPEDVASALVDDVKTPTWMKVAEAATNAFRDGGFTGTPTVTLNGVVNESYGGIDTAAITTWLAGVADGSIK